MCFFHVMQNVRLFLYFSYFVIIFTNWLIDKIRKHKHLIHKSKYDGLLDDMRSLHNSNNFFILRLNVDTCYNECSCTCSLFFCMHLIAFSNLFGKGLFGEQWYNVPTQFNHAPKRGRKTKKTCYGTISKRR